MLLILVQIHWLVFNPSTTYGCFARWTFGYREILAHVWFSPLLPTSSLGELKTGQTFHIVTQSCVGEYKTEQIVLLYPLGITLSVRLSICPSVCADSCPAINFFCFDIGLPYLAYGCITMRWCRVDVDLWPQGQIYRVYDVALFSGPAFLSFGIVIPCMACGTMCRVHPYPLFDLDHWPQYQNYIFTMNLCLGKIVLSLFFDIDILYLAYTCIYGCITMRQHVVYILDHCMTIDLYVGGLEGGGYP